LHRQYQELQHTMVVVEVVEHKTQVVLVHNEVD
jgi:hypothetical protein